jgi:hypothetical protein
VQPGRQQLLGVEGVALGTRDDVLDDGLAHRAGLRARPADQRADVRIREGGELQPLHAGQPHQLGEQRTQGMAPVAVVAAVGGDHGHRLVDEQVAQQVATGPVGPVDVLEHQQQRPRAGQPAGGGAARCGRGLLRSRSSPDGGSRSTKGRQGDPTSPRSTQ